MSFFSGYDFFVCLIILLIPAAVLGLLEKRLTWYRWLLSIVFIWQVYGDTPRQLLYLIGYVLFSTYLVKIYLFLRTNYGRNKYFYGHAVFLALLPLIVYKVGGGVERLLGIWFFRYFLYLFPGHTGYHRKL